MQNSTWLRRINSGKIALQLIIPPVYNNSCGGQPRISLTGDTKGNDRMKLDISTTKAELGKRAAIAGATLIREALADRGEANIIVATGASQFEMLGELVQVKDIA